MFPATDTVENIGTPVLYFHSSLPFIRFNAYSIPSEAPKKIVSPTNTGLVSTVEDDGLEEDELRAIVRHERRVELAFEDLRFADLYRWKDFENAQKRMQEDKSFYGFGAVERNNLRGAQDLVWPIPQSEIDTNPMLEQHSEWK